MIKRNGQGYECDLLKQKTSSNNQRGDKKKGQKPGCTQQ
ncbi:unnamed protein product [Paramecium sonneborni]|uniref:Uncharacterized protein n=1 Tax=Paramecium sonneborni TaxID=65129 RepID=A0A8S1RHA9_9CILI|nr:unnamed protein product [Paramecium sonneborni]